MINLPSKPEGFKAYSRFYNYIKQQIDSFSSSQKYTILTLVDISLFALSIFAATSLEYGVEQSIDALSERVDLVLLALAIESGTFWVFNIYRQVLRSTDGEFFLTIFKAILVSYIAIFAVDLLFLGNIIPASIEIDNAMFALILAISVRLSVRQMLTKVRPISNSETEADSPGERLLLRQRLHQRQRVVIYGAGSSGSSLARALGSINGKQLVGFVDDNPHLQGRIIGDTKVYAPAELLKLKASIGFEEILISMPSISSHRKRALSQRLQILGVPVKSIPSITEILNDNGAIKNNQVPELDLEDLLGRKAIAACPELLQQDITDRVVLVTGGGGSIGSELCRQIAKQQPQLLIVYELHEFALYQMDMELGEQYPQLKKVAFLGSVTDSQSLTRVLKQYQVNTIYHAAAYKHVPIVEANPLSGTINNISGTLTAAQCAIDCQVAKFVLISTDKAVRPTNIMGATKRVAELVLQGLADLPTHATCFTMVRFGNVLGSSGSVVPRFREQIISGKPITLTHPEITRYFMTIPEAASLVIQAGAMGKGGEVFLLNMGEPVKIYDLAVQMIRLHGLEPDRDIKIEVTGLRPGEKIYEELLIDCDAALPTGHPKIFCAREAKLAWTNLQPQLTSLLDAALNSDVDKCVSVLHDLVPEYQPMGQYAKINIEASQTLAASIHEKLKKAELDRRNKREIPQKSADRSGSLPVLTI